MIICNEWVNYIIPITIIIVCISNNYYLCHYHWLLPISNVDLKRKKNTIPNWTHNMCHKRKINKSINSRWWIPMIRSPKNIHQDGKIHRVLHGRTDQTVALIRAQDASQRVATHFGTRKEFLAEWSVMAAMMRELWPWLSVCGSMKGS